MASKKQKEGRIKKILQRSRRTHLVHVDDGKVVLVLPLDVVPRGENEVGGKAGISRHLRGRPVFCAWQASGAPVW